MGLILLVSGSLALPQAGYNAPKCEKKRVAQPTSYDCTQDKECTTTYEDKCETKYAQECETKYEEKCEVEYQQKCETKYEEQCEIEYQEQCETKYEQQCKTEYDEQCETKYEQKCETGYENKCRTEYDQQCETKYEQKCETKYETQYEVRWYIVVVHNFSKYNLLGYNAQKAQVTLDKIKKLINNTLLGLKGMASRVPNMKCNPRLKGNPWIWIHQLSIVANSSRFELI